MLYAIFDEIVAEYAGTHVALALAVRNSTLNLGVLIIQMACPLIYNIRHSILHPVWFMMSFVAVSCVATVLAIMLDSKAQFKVGGNGEL